jgi:hypothetical protein
MKVAATLNTAIDQFLFAHDRYLELDRARFDCQRPSEREQMYIAILKAYLEVQFRARVITGLQYADGMDFAETN